MPQEAAKSYLRDPETLDIWLRRGYIKDDGKGSQAAGGTTMTKQTRMAIFWLAIGVIIFAGLSTVEHGDAGSAIIGIALFSVYFLPAIIANNRNHHNKGAVFALNLLLGWTLLGWIGALVWSLTRTEDAETAREIRSMRAALAKRPLPPVLSPPIDHAAEGVHVADDADVTVERPGHRPMTIHGRT